MKILSKNDGIDHINIYSQGLTELGKLLSNFAHTPFTHPTYGKFSSIEGLWYWLKCKRMFGIEYLELKMAHGNTAKTRGKELFLVSEDEIPNFPDDQFKNDIIQGIQSKLRQNKNILNLLVATELPLLHYYVIDKNTKNEFLKQLPQHQWQIDEINRLRTVSQEFLKQKNKTSF